MHNPQSSPSRGCLLNERCVYMIFSLIAVAGLGMQAAEARDIDLSEAVILIAEEPYSKGEIVAAQMLREEVQKRTGLRWEISTQEEDLKPMIALASSTGNELAGLTIPRRDGPDLPEAQEEGYRICVEPNRESRSAVWILGADARGILFGAGRLLRLLHWGPGQASLPDTTDIATSPAYPIRGHQLGYRARANSYDAWDASAYEQYIRDLILFGCNCIENIPFEDDQPSPHMRVLRDEMN